MNVVGKKTVRTFNGQTLVALVEMGRLLCCNGRKLRSFLKSFQPLVLEENAADQEELFPFADPKTYTAELVRHKIQQNVKVRWEPGTVGVHAIKLHWWHSTDARTKDYLVGRPSSKKEMATLLTIANRGSDTTACKTDRREREINFAVLPDNVGDTEISAIIETYVRKQLEKSDRSPAVHKPVQLLCLVANETQGGSITALKNKTLLEAKLKALGVKVCVDIPTVPPDNGEIIEITTALPNSEALENYIAMIMKSGKIPKRTEKWKTIRANSHDRAEINRQLGSFRPILAHPPKENK